MERQKIGEEGKKWQGKRKQMKNKLNLNEGAIKRITDEEEGRVEEIVVRITGMIRNEGRKNRREKKSLGTMRCIKT